MNGWKAAALAMLFLAGVAGLAGRVGAGDDTRTASRPGETLAPELAAVLQPSPAPDHPVVQPLTPTGVNDADNAVNWPLTLPEALRIAMDNSDFVRVLGFSAHNLPVGGFAPAVLGTAGKDRQARSVGMVIGKFDGAAPVWRVKTEVMARCRSVEQQYWNLVQTHVQRESAQRAANFGQEILDRETADLAKGRGTVADVAEAALRLEQFNLDLVTRTSDVITTERQLRTTLGLPAADRRSIVPITKPTEEPPKLEGVTPPTTGGTNKNRDHKTETASVELPAAGPAEPALAISPAPIQPFQPVTVKKTETDGASNQGPPTAKPTPRTWSFSFSIGRDNPFMIKGTISETTNDRPDTNEH